jgi:hypothetical protein
MMPPQAVAISITAKMRVIMRASTCRPSDFDFF